MQGKNRERKIKERERKQGYENEAEWKGRDKRSEGKG